MMKLDRRSFMMALGAAVTAGLIPAVNIADKPIQTSKTIKRIGTIKTEWNWVVEKAHWLVTGYWRDKTGMEFVAGVYMNDDEIAYRQKRAEALSKIIDAFERQSNVGKS